MLDILVGVIAVECAINSWMGPNTEMSCNPSGNELGPKMLTDIQSFLE